MSEFAAEKKQTALLSVISNTFLITAKLIVGFLSGSVSILSEAAHSFADLLAAIIAFFAVRISSEPADDEHQFGHGKFEDLSGLVEGALIVLIAFYIIYESAIKLTNGVEEHLETTAGIIVMLFSVIVNVFVSRRLFAVARKSDSMALLADAEHLRTDVYTSFGVFIGLILIKLTGLTFLDPLVAIFIAFIIIKTGYELCKTSINNLVDYSLPEEDKNKINETISKYISDTVIEVKNLKTRKAGSTRLIELRLKVPTDMTIKEGHDICDSIESEIESTIKNSDVIIHLEPCDKECIGCIMFDNRAFQCNHKD